MVYPNDSNEILVNGEGRVYLVKTRFVEEKGSPRREWTDLVWMSSDVDVAVMSALGSKGSGGRLVYEDDVLEIEDTRVWARWNVERSSYELVSVQGEGRVLADSILQVNLEAGVVVGNRWENPEMIESSVIRALSGEE